MSLIKVAVCDDEADARDKLSSVLDEYRDRYGRDMEVSFFRSPLDMLNDMDRGPRFDLLLLDVLMPGINGIEAAAEIRRTDKCVKIIFLTNSAEFAVESYSVNAFYYLLKPISAEKLFPLLDSVCEEHDRDRADSIVLKCADGFTAVRVANIAFCEVIHRTLFIHMVSGTVHQSGGSLDNFGETLSGYRCFMRVHRSYIVNLNHISSVSGRFIIMSDMTRIPIPKGRYAEIKNTFLENAFHEVHEREIER